MQLLVKFKKILYMGFRATLNFRKFKVALNPMYRIVVLVVCVTFFYSSSTFSIDKPLELIILQPFFFLFLRFFFLFCK